MTMPNRQCGKCGSRLSQYNSEALCAACTRLGEAPQVADRAWRDERVLRALSAWEFGEVLGLLRRRSGLSQMDVCLLTGLTQSYVSDLERGRKQLTGRDAIIDVLTGLALPADLRARLLDPLGGPAFYTQMGELAPDLPWTADRMVLSIEVAIGGAMKRRSVLAALGGAGLTHYVLQSAIAPAEAMASVSADGIKVTPHLIESLQATTNALREIDASSGSGSLAATATTHLKTLLNLLRNGTYTDAISRRLAAVTADTAMQAGWYTFDSGAHGDAHGLFLGALRAAHASGDTRLRAGALAYLAIHGYSVGDPRDAVTAARTARQVINNQDSPALHAMLLTRQARGHARLHEDRHALAALDEAWELCGRGPGENDPHWLYWINEGEILGQRGSCYLDLGRPAEAAAAFADAREVLSRDETRTRAQFLSRAATAQMRAGDAEAGCATGQEVLTLAGRVRSARLDEQLQSMLSEVRHFGDSAIARDLLDQGRTVLRERTAA
ncbi:helix-turn-helix transcriptional regulator [Streptomyces sp. NPDC001787]|uniref:helix-turn-helix domain-containing protein n=1 Tax=Streptomyces sp. NPDC001787 TaxID=3154523 RepID=UPI00331D5645